MANRQGNGACFYQVIMEELTLFVGFDQRLTGQCR